VSPPSNFTWRNEEKALFNLFDRKSIFLVVLNNSFGASPVSLTILLLPNQKNMQLLRIDTSTRIHDSHSRKVADEFQKQWKSINPAGKVVHRDLVKNPPPHLSDLTIQGFYTPEEAKTPELKDALKLSDEFIAELKASDTVVISLPMYNFGIPSSLKAYIDHISRVNQTFEITEQGAFKPLISTVRKIVFITATGAVFSNPQMQALDFMTPYLKTIFGFLGITNMQVLAIEGSSMDPVAFEESKADVSRKILEWAD